MKPYLVFTLFIMLHSIYICKALNCQPNSNTYTLTVAKSGQANFSSIQSAINCVPDGNSQWIHILISSGIYREKLTIPANKTCIFIEGAGIKKTIIDWNDSEATNTSATFTSYADNILVKSVTIKNSYDLVAEGSNNTINASDLKQAVAARIQGNKSAFHKCGFLGAQDTLWDEGKHHYFKGCLIEGAVDFIFGEGQSIYQGCIISVNVANYGGGLEIQGSITAQRKEKLEQDSGFVFKDCVIKNKTGQVLLGRAWGPYSTVIFHNTYMSDVVAPQGWNAWYFASHEGNLTYVEDGNRGPGADLSKRVPWEKKLGPDQLSKFLDISYINQDDWLSQLPYKLDK